MLCAYTGLGSAMNDWARKPLRMVRLWIIALALATIAGAARATPDADGTWWWAYQTGVMTDGRAGDAIDPGDLELTENYILGGLLGYDRQIGNSRFSFGVEIQANAHFGEQGFYEVVLPVSARYHFENSWWDAFDSVGFGVGYSHYSEISDIERSNYDGESRRNLIYWYLELEFAELKPGDNLFVRLHHRSNGYDTVEPNGGSNAWIVGFRRAF